MKRFYMWGVFCMAMLVLGTGCGTLEVAVGTKTPLAATERPVAVAEVTSTVTAAVTATKTAVLPTTTKTAVLPTAMASPLPTAVLPTHTAAPPPTVTSPPPTNTPPPPPTVAPTVPSTPYPLALSLAADPIAVTPGGTVTLTWEGVGDEATICLRTLVGTTRECQDVPLQGSMPYTLDPVYRIAVDFELRVTANGNTDTYAISVRLPCPDDWWFFDNPPDICPAADPIHSQAAEQSFQYGRMLWVEELEAIYVFFDDDHTYRIYYDPQNVVNPQEPVGDPPAGFFAPISGFGLVWRGEVAGSEDVRQRLGWALEPESGFETTYQWDAAFWYPRFYFLLPQEQIISLNLSLATWSLWQ